MSDYRVTSRYAKSLIDLAVERNALERVKADIELFSATVASSRDLALMLRNPIISHLTKLQILKRLFADKMDVLTMSFFDILSRKNREEVLPEVAQEFLAQYNIIKGIAKAEVTVAAPLSKEAHDQLSKIAQQLTGQEIELAVKINPDVLGGFSLRTGDHLLDATVRKKLNVMDKGFNENPFISKI